MYAIAIAILAILSFILIDSFFFGLTRYGVATNVPNIILHVFAVVLALAAAVVIRPSRSRRRRFWEWLGFGKTGKKAGLDLFQFFVALSIPFAVVGIGAYFTASQAQDTALQSYLDGMAKLVIDNDLANSEEGDEVRTLARARTLTVLASLDPQHKRSVLEFLSSSNLIGAKTPVITLARADLSDAILIAVDLRNVNLMGARLSRADLRGAQLREADLSGAYLDKAKLFQANLVDANLRRALLSNADLSNTDLSNAYLREAGLMDADLSNADLSNADLERATVTDEQLDAAKSLRGATMPDGSKHD